jgi:pimeloyl-ACP methyl ester carboxylesterase
MRYLIDESAAEGIVNPPILFYCGNEGDVWTFYNNSGFVTNTLPPQVNGLVLFGEHRYYGQSMPFGDQSYTPENVKFLTVDQAMQDYVNLIQNIKASNVNYTFSTVIAFGGSYGGMLAAWMRMKYPFLIHGAHAASAPILFFSGVTSPYAYNDLATRDFAQADPNCPVSIRKGFTALDRLGMNSTNYNMITDTFKLCSNLTARSQVDELIASITDGFGSMAMVDYPYPTGFLSPLPANPVSVTCKSIASMTPQSDDDYLKILATAN